MAAMCSLCTMPCRADSCCSELLFSIFQVWIVALLHGTHSPRPAPVALARAPLPPRVATAAGPHHSRVGSVPALPSSLAPQVNCAAHNYHGWLGTAICAHFCAAIPNFKILEVDVDDVPWKDEIVTSVPQIVDGIFQLPLGPGWGVEVNEQHNLPLRTLATHPPWVTCPRLYPSR